MKITRRTTASRTDPPLQTRTNLSPMQTAGGQLQDGSFLELVLPSGSDRLQLVRSTGAQVSKPMEEIAIGAKKYVPIQLDVSWLRAIRFPQGLGEVRKTSDLFSNVSAFFTTSITCEPEAAELMAAFVFATWFSDILEVVPSLWVVALDATDRWVLLRLLSYVCRRPVLLAGCTPSALGGIPAELQPTLLFEAASKPSFARVLTITTRRGFFAPRSGRALDQSFAVGVVSSDWADTDIPLVKVAFPPGSARHFAGSVDTLENASAALQADLLRYRVGHYRQVREANPKPPPFTSEMQLVAASLTACVDDEAVRERICAVLQAEDQQARAERATDIHAIAVEALLVACHQRKLNIFVGELAELGNDLLMGREEAPRFTPRGFGSMLRSLGFKNLRRMNDGWNLTIDAGVRARVHRLARNYAVDTLPQPDCVECAEDASADGECRERREH